MLSDVLANLPQYCLPHHLLSRALGKIMDCRITFIKNSIIRLLTHVYKINLSEAENPNPEDYASFNDFFTRHLKAGARPVVSDANAIASPADGIISHVGRIDQTTLIQAKNHDYDLVALIGGHEHRAEPFINGYFATIYLSPRDYHRVHMPISGTLHEMIHIPGKLFSVQPRTVRTIPRLFARNERVACLFETEVGPMAVIMVGAMLVASIETVWAGIITPPQTHQITATRYSAPDTLHLQRGDELGCFRFGSTAIVLFPENSLAWIEQTQPGKHLHMGQLLGYTK